MNPYIILGGLGLLYFATQNQPTSTDETTYLIQKADGTTVRLTRTQLQAAGYVEAEPGKWIPAAAAAQLSATGAMPGTPAWQTVVQSALTVVQTSGNVVNDLTLAFQKPIARADAAKIKAVQTLINAHLLAPLPRIAVNGVWDTATKEAAVRVFGIDVSNKKFGEIQTLAASKGWVLKV